MNFNLINVGIADSCVASPPNILRTILGSCVGICLYDKENSIAGLSHIMLPVQNEKLSNPKKYADSAIPLLVEDMEKAGAKRTGIVAKIVGGSTMFKMTGNSMMSEIGKNNIQKVKEILGNLNIKIIAEDIGGDYGRTIDFYSEGGSLKIKSLGRPEKVL